MGLRASFLFGMRVTVAGFKVYGWLKVEGRFGANGWSFGAFGVRHGWCKVRQIGRVEGLKIG